MGFLKTTNQPANYHRLLANRPQTTEQLTTDQMHQPLFSKKFEDQKKFEFMFDITHDFTYSF